MFSGISSSAVEKEECARSVPSIVEAPVVRR